MLEQGLERKLQILFAVYTTQVNSAFYAFWLASLEVNSKYYSPPRKRRKTKWLPVSLRVTVEQLLSINEAAFPKHYKNGNKVGSADHSACIVHTKTIIHLSVGKKWWIFIVLYSILFWIIVIVYWTLKSPFQEKNIYLDSLLKWCPKKENFFCFFFPQEDISFFCCCFLAFMLCFIS